MLTLFVQNACRGIARHPQQWPSIRNVSRTFPRAPLARSHFGRVGPRNSRQYSSYHRGSESKASQVIFWSIVAINGGVFVAWKLAQIRANTENDRTYLNWMYDNFTIAFNGGLSRPWTLLTCSFSHSDVMHMVVNGIGIFWIGRDVLWLIGPVRFLVVYLGGGIFCSLASYMHNNLSRSGPSYALGASGSLTSCLSFIAFAIPKSKFALYGIIPMPLWMIAGGVLAWDLYGLANPPERESGSMLTDHAGHLGGFAWGSLAYIVLRRRIWWM